MSKLVDRAVAELSRLPPERQDEIARFLLTLTAEPEPLTEDEARAIAVAEAELARGEAVPDAVMAEFWRAQGLAPT